MNDLPGDPTLPPGVTMNDIDPPLENPCRECMDAEAGTSGLCEDCERFLKEIGRE